jgi:hypothetical protein
LGSGRDFSVWIGLFEFNRTAPPVFCEHISYEEEGGLGKEEGEEY